MMFFYNEDLLLLNIRAHLGLVSEMRSDIIRPKPF